jgi:hypothetical protein
VRRGRVAALIALAAAPACAIALGVQNDPKLVTATICACDPWHGIPACQSDLDARLNGANEADRAAWLQNFAASCSKTCDDMKPCFYTPPGCVQTGNACTADAECCTYKPDASPCMGAPDGLCK